jgi:hypothetical protein
MSDPKLLNVPLLVFANKIDIHHDTADMHTLVDKLSLSKLQNRSWLLQRCSALTGEGISEGLEWISGQLPD